MKRLFAVSMVCLFGWSTLFAFDGVWGFKTDLLQAFYQGRVLGYAEPESSNRVTLVSFVDGTRAELVYGDRVFDVTWKQEGNALVFSSPRWPAPLPVTLLRLSEEAFRFSYTLVDAKEAVSPTQGQEAFLNYIGTFIRLGNRGEVKR
jgi:hypothetical protein